MIDPLYEALYSFGEISRLSLSDYQMIQSYYDTQSISYAKSWLYLLRASRYSNGELGCKIFHNNMLLLLGYRNDLCFIVNPASLNVIPLVMSVCERLHDRKRCGIILKKVNSTLASYLLDTGHFESISNTFQPNALEDDLFPEHEVFLEDLFNSDLSLKQSARIVARSVRRFQKETRLIEAKSWISYEQARQGLQRLSASNSDKYNSYLPIIQTVFLHSSPNSSYRCMCFHENELIHGLYIAEYLGNNSTMGLYCALSSRDGKGITEWMDIEFFRDMYRCGVKKILFGGSETLGVHNYVQKLFVRKPSNISYTLKYKFQN